jgi:hypothetical protein
LEGIKKRKLLLFRHSGGLRSGLVEESYLPSSEGGTGSVEDEVIPLFPNLPSSNYESFHEEDRAELSFCLLHHSMERKIKSPVNA